MENKQTAVMTLAKAFREWQKEWDRFDKEKTKQPKSFDEFIEPFLEMEKEQIKIAVKDSWYMAKGSNFQEPQEEQYYNETYGSSTPELRYRDGSPMRKYNSPKLQAIEMENNKTPVEWLFQKLWDEPKDKFTWYALREKAIQMEKEQLDNARPQIVSNCVIKEISDEEIREQAINYDNKAFSETPLAHFMEGALWYREQIKKRK